MRRALIVVSAVALVCGTAVAVGARDGPRAHVCAMEPRGLLRIVGTPDDCGSNETYYGLALDDVVQSGIDALAGRITQESAAREAADVSLRSDLDGLSLAFAALTERVAALEEMAEGPRIVAAGRFDRFGVPIGAVFGDLTVELNVDTQYILSFDDYSADKSYVVSGTTLEPAQSGNRRGYLVGSHPQLDRRGGVVTGGILVEWVDNQNQRVASFAVQVVEIPTSS